MEDRDGGGVVYVLVSVCSCVIVSVCLGECVCELLFGRVRVSVHVSEEDTQTVGGRENGCRDMRRCCWGRPGGRRRRSMEREECLVGRGNSAALLLYNIVCLPSFLVYYYCYYLYCFVFRFPQYWDWGKLWG